MIPMVGFGFVDNCGMILAGESIDNMLGATLCISTMATAALGNTVSDIAGIGLSNSIEAGAEKLGIPSPGLTLQQLDLPISRVVITLSSVLGITTGCILGMTPLLFMNSGEKDLRVLFDEIDSDHNGIIDAADVKSALKKMNIEVDEAKFMETFHDVSGDPTKSITFQEFVRLVKSLGHKIPVI
jgi:hypothetical protein